MEETVEINNQFSEFLKEKRIALGLSLRDFSTLIYGRSNKFNHLYSLETGKRKATLATMEFILKKLNCTFNIEEN